MNFYFEKLNFEFLIQVSDYATTHHSLVALPTVTTSLTAPVQYNHNSTRVHATARVMLAKFRRVDKGRRCVPGAARCSLTHHHVRVRYAEYIVVPPCMYALSLAAASTTRPHRPLTSRYLTWPKPRRCPRLRTTPCRHRRGRSSSHTHPIIPFKNAR